MTNNEFNEFENTDIDRMEQDQAGPRPTGFKSNLSEAWRTRPLFKLLVLMIIVAAVVAASVSFFSGKNRSTDVTKIVNPPDMHEAPGGLSSPFVRQQTELANEKRTEDALNNHGSAVPTPIGQNTDPGDLIDRSKPDPLNELRNQIQQLQKQQQQQQVQQQQVEQKIQQPVQPQKPPEQFDDSLAQAMQRQMQQLMEGWKPTGVRQVSVIKPEELKKEQQGVESNAAAAAQANAAQSQNPVRILVPAGTVSYGQLLTEANSDVKGPILAQIVSGPLAGGRAVGSFEVINQYADYLVLKFTLVSLKGKEYQMNAIALDPDTTLGGLATEVDQRYFARVILPAAAGFLEGFGQALGQNSTSTTTNGQFAITQQAKAGVEQGIFQGLGQAANTSSQFFQNQANQTKPLVRVAAGTPMGIFFITSVKDRDLNTYGPGQQGYQGYGFNGAANALGPYGNNAFASNPYGANPYASNPYLAQAQAQGLLNGSSNPYGSVAASYNGGAGYPGTTVAGYGNAGAAGSNNNPDNVPYPNAGNQTYNPSTLTTPGSSLTITPGIGSYGNH